LSSERSRLQEIADSAALAAAAELGVSSSDDAIIREVAEAFVFAQDQDVEVDVVLGDDEQDVEVKLSKYWEPLLIHHMNQKALPIKINATASKAGTDNICILALHEKVSDGFEISGEGSIIAEECSVHSNSTSKSSIVLSNKAELTAKSICSGGGVSGSATPKPPLDCPPISDPLVNRSYPNSIHCDHRRMVISGDGNHEHNDDDDDDDDDDDIIKAKKVLQPGNYCGGLTVTNGAEVELESGLYRFLNGPFVVDGHSTITGNYVTLQFTGKKSYVHFKNSSTISFKAMKSGPTAGMLIMADYTVKKNKVFKIQSLDAKEFTGLVYVPNNRVEIGTVASDSEPCAAGGLHGPTCKHCLSSFGQLSDWTAIVAKQIKAFDGVKVVMNADYENSDVPLPQGNGLMGTIVRLSE